MSDFDLQGLVQVGITTDRSAHKRIVNDAVAELTRLQSELADVKRKNHCQSEQLNQYADEVERLRGQMSEHEEEMALFMSVAVLICKQESNEWDSDQLQTYKDYAEVCGERIEKLSPVNATAWLLRKQAEAVEAFALHISCMANDDSDDWWSVSKNPLEQIEDAKEYAKYLHQKADEAEKTGG